MKKLFLGLALLSSALYGAEEYKIVFGVDNVKEECQTLFDLCDFLRMRRRAGAIVADKYSWINGVRVADGVKAYLRENLPHQEEFENRNYNGVVIIPFQALSEDDACDFTNYLLGGIKNRSEITTTSLVKKQKTGNWRSVFLDYPGEQDEEDDVYSDEQEN